MRKIKPEKDKKWPIGDVGMLAWISSVDASHDPLALSVSVLLIGYVAECISDDSTMPVRLLLTAGFWLLLPHARVTPKRRARGQKF